VDRAVAVGWSRARVGVMDEEQGQSGQRMVTRLGFQRVLAAVSLDHVGLLLGLERRRWARSHKDGHQWLERCASLRTLWAAADGLDEPTDSNDRCLFGLRGRRSEAALSLRQGRRWEGMRTKARRGALRHPPPMGSVRSPAGDDPLDPDAQAQRVVRLICDVFEPQGTLHGVLRSLVAQDMRVPMRPHAGLNRGPLAGRRPTRMTLHNLLHPPISAGASRGGHRQRDPRPHQPGRRSTGRTIHGPAACDVLIPHRFPAYIRWERCAALQPR